MNDEEKKAIEDLRGYLKWNDKNGFSRLPRDNHIETVLNLISKLQKELDKKNICLRACEDNLIKERQLRIKQDKVIDLMAEYLNENNREFWTDDIEETKQYFFKKVEEEND